MAEFITFVIVNEDEGDTDDDLDVLGNALMAEIAQQFTRNPKTRIEGYVEDVIPNYSGDEFKRMFRLSRETFDIICEYIKHCPELLNTGYGGREPISHKKQMYIFLWYLGGQDNVVKIADRFGVAESSVIMSRNRIVDAILNHLKKRFIVWPKDGSIRETIDGFKRRNGFPGIIGALDGTHISIRPPKDNPQSYVNRKKFHSLQLQAVCDADMKFLDCFTGFPGSCHDARVLKQSSLWEKGPTICNQNHLLGDGAYPLRRWLLTPYRDNGHLSQEQKNFNFKLSSNRVVIERAFGLLKGRFRRLDHIESQSVTTAVKVIMASCVLHNICVVQKEDIDQFLTMDNNNNGQSNTVIFLDNEAAGIIKRNILARRLPRN